MNQLKSNDEKRQQLWDHNSRSYSIVDLTIFPHDRLGGGVRAITDQRLESYARAMSFYKPYHIEVADITGRIEILGRYKSFEEAQKAIESGTVHEDTEYDE